MKKRSCIVIICVLIISLFSPQTAFAQTGGVLNLTVTASQDIAAIGDEVSIVISLGNAAGSDMSAFSFLIQLPAGLRLKPGTCAVTENFQNATGMYMTAFDESPLFMVSGFGGLGYNGSAIAIAEFVCVAVEPGTQKIDLYEIDLYGVGGNRIQEEVIPATIIVTQPGSANTDSNNSSGDNNNSSNQTGDVNASIGVQSGGNSMPQYGGGKAPTNVVNPDNKSSTTGSNASIIETPKITNNEQSKPKIIWLNPFVDVAPADWFYKYVEFVHANGIMIGTNDNMFEPNTPVTRAMFVRVIANMEKADMSGGNTSRFSDVPPGQWYTAAIEWAAENNIVSGVGYGFFDPNSNITREQTALIINNYLQYKGLSGSGASTSQAFADENEISSWAIDAVKIMQSEGIILGKLGNRFEPKASATRAEIATIVTRLTDNN